MSRRTRRRKPCPLCWDMGADAPAVTHRVVHRFPEGWSNWLGPGFGPSVIRVQVCEHHAHEARVFRPRPHASVYRLKGARR
jgi:hypothetical protein